MNRQQAEERAERLRRELPTLHDVRVEEVGWIVVAQPDEHGPAYRVPMGEAWETASAYLEFLAAKQAAEESA